MENTILKNVKYNIEEFVGKFNEYVLQNLFIIVFFYIVRKYIRSLISKEKYKLIKPLLKTRYLKFNIENMSDVFTLTDEEVEYYLNILSTLPVYEKLTVTKFLELIYECGLEFDEEENQDFDYDGFDVGRYVLYKPFIGKRKFLKVVEKGDEKFVFVLENGKKINLMFLNFLFYTPVSTANKRKLLIKKLK